MLLLLRIRLGKHGADCASADPMKHSSRMVAKQISSLTADYCGELLRRSGPLGGRRSTKHRRHRHTVAYYHHQDGDSLSCILCSRSHCAEGAKRNHQRAIHGLSHYNWHLFVSLIHRFQDEPFHISQAQAYCRGEFLSWNPKITTPPGL